RLAAVALREVEHHVGRLGAQTARERVEIVAEPEEPHLVPALGQRARHVELGLVGGLELFLVLVGRGRLRVRIEEDEHARFLHLPTFHRKRSRRAASSIKRGTLRGFRTSRDELRAAKPRYARRVRGRATYLAPPSGRRGAGAASG